MTSGLWDSPADHNLNSFCSFSSALVSQVTCSQAPGFKTRTPLGRPTLCLQTGLGEPRRGGGGGGEWVAVWAQRDSALSLLVTCRALCAEPTVLPCRPGEMQRHGFPRPQRARALGLAARSW